jgi:uncharacterized protein YqgQ
MPNLFGLKEGVTEEFVSQQIQELWHNLFRIHSYLEIELLKNLDGERPVILQRADMLLKASYARAESVLADSRLLEKPSRE